MLSSVFDPSKPLGAILILTLSTLASGQDVTLSIPLETEPTGYDSVCWAACSYMVLKDYNVWTDNYGTNLVDIINRETQGADVGVTLSDPKSVRKTLAF